MTEETAAIIGCALMVSPLVLYAIPRLILEGIDLSSHGQDRIGFTDLIPPPFPTLPPTIDGGSIRSTRLQLEDKLEGEA